MKKMLVTVLILALSSFVFAGDFVEGKNYVILDMPKQENTVWKVYSVYCPFCNKYEKSVTPNMIKNLPAGTHYEAIFLANKGQYGPEAANVLAALITLDKDKYEKAKLAYYKEAIDNKEKNIKNKGAENFINIGLKAAGITKEEYENALNKKETQDLLIHWEKIALPVAAIQGVPAFVVNGKYLIKTDSITSVDMFNQLIAYLLTLK